MSEENLELVQRFLDAAEQGDWKSAAELLDPDVEQHGAVGGLEEGQVYRGLDEMIREYETVDLEVWEERRLDREKFLHGDDLVVLLLHRSGGFGTVPVLPRLKVPLAA